MDSSVAALLLNQAIGKHLTCVFVDNGLLRQGEATRVRELFQKTFQNQPAVCPCQETVSRWAERGCRSGKETQDHRPHFHRGFRKGGQEDQGVKFLAQGTLYPDHHRIPLGLRRSERGDQIAPQCGRAPEKDESVNLIEPLKHLFKDEVRLLGKELGLSDDLVWRQPFPGPGLAVRIIGEVTPSRLSILRKADVDSP